MELGGASTGLSRRQCSHGQIEAGFTLVEVLVASSILGMLVLTMATFMVNQFRSIGYLEDRFSQMSLRTELTNSLSYPASCLNTLGGQDLGSKSIPAVRDSFGNSIVALSGPQSQRDRLDVVAINFENIDVPAAPNSSGRASLSVQTRRQRTGGGPSAFRPIQIEVVVDTDNASNIVNCRHLPINIPEKSVEIQRYAFAANRAQWNYECTSGGNVGPNRTCFTKVREFSSTYRYNGAGCRYTKSTGAITICGQQTVVTCDVICFD